MTAATTYAGRAKSRSDRRRAKPSPLLIALAAAGLAAVAYATLCPIGLRPHLASANLERFGAWLALGFLVSRAAGRKALVATAAIVIAAIALEAAQRLAPGRHPALTDAAVKALGGVIGVAAFQLSFPFKRWLVRTAVPSLVPAPHPVVVIAPIRVR